MTQVKDRPVGRAERARGAAAAAMTRTTRVVDRLTDGAVLVFAAWTVIYHLGLLFRPRTSVLLIIWLVAAALIATGYALRSRGPGGGPLWRDLPRRPWTGLPGTVPVIAVVAGITAGACAGLHPSGVPWWCAWVPGLVSVAASAVWVLAVSGRSSPEPHAAGHSTLEASEGVSGHGGEGPERAASRWGTPLALLTGAGFAVGSLFIVNSDGDDAYFVSRSVATAAMGKVPLKDVIFTSGGTNPIAGEPPVSSFEVLVGAVARVLGVPASSFLWYVVLPAVTFLAIWSLWRLVREWAPRRAAAVFTVAAVYLLWSGLGRASLGSFHLVRMWQGKAVLVSALIPLLYAYLTRWAERRSRQDLILLGATGISAIGLTSTASFIVPLVVGAAAVPLIVAGRVRTGLAAFAAMAYPIGTGLTVILLHDDTSVLGSIQDAPTSFSWVFLQSTLGVLGGCALWLSPWTARRGVPALIAAGIAAVPTLAILPGVLEAATDATGAGQVLWRSMWVAPVPVLVGLLAAVRVPDTVRLPSTLRGRAPRLPAAAFPSVALVVALVAGGMPVWSSANGSRVSTHPAWKVPAEEVGTARAVVRAAGPGDVVLMPKNFMRVVPLLTARVHAVNPNDHYLTMIPASPQFIEDRLVLTRVVRAPDSYKPGRTKIREALARVGVDVACAVPADTRGLARLEEAGFGGRKRIGDLVCVFPQGGRSRP